MSCPHLGQLDALQAPRLSQAVHREECTQCFDNQDSAGGVEVCLTCFNGGCGGGNGREHGKLHAERLRHPFTLNVKRREKAKAKSTKGRGRGEDEAPPAKMARLAIVEEREEDRFECSGVVKCWLCGGLEIPQANVSHAHLVAGVLSSMSSARASEVKAWEEEILPCTHTATLSQTQVPTPVSSTHCAQCALAENLWLCLTCGALGCGRAQFGGAGGNGHGLAHYGDTGHPVSVKLGTITAEGSADAYCYACNDATLDVDMALHLLAFGIKVEGLTKTEKSMTELQVEHNLRYEFSLGGEDGRGVEPVCGPGLTGLANLGNSCYLASVVQVLFALPAFRARYGGGGGDGGGGGGGGGEHEHARVCGAALPAECVECQMRKMADGLLSGRYSVPAPAPTNHATSPSNASPLLNADASPSPLLSSPPHADADADPDADADRPAFQAGLKPSGLKALVGRGHAEFATMRQQDAEEFFSHFVGVLRRDAASRADSGGGGGGGDVVMGEAGTGGQDTDTDGAGGEDATATFAYGMEQRLACGECGGVRYRVDAGDVVSVGVPAVKVQGKGKSKGESPSQSGSESSADKEGASTGAGTGAGADGGKAVSADDNKKDAHEYEYEPVALQTCLEALLQPEAVEYRCPRCKRGVSAVRQSRFATLPATLVVHAKKFALVNWVPAKLDIPVILPAHDELVFTAAHMGRGLRAEEGEEALGDEDEEPAPAPQINAEALAQLEGMGFPGVRCRKALRATGNANAEAAMEWLFAHMEDPGIDDEDDATTTTTMLVDVDEAQVGALVEMGFSRAQGRRALRETGGSAEGAVEWLFAHPDEVGDEEEGPTSASSFAGGGGSHAAATSTGQGGSGAENNKDKENNKEGKNKDKEGKNKENKEGEKAVAVGGRADVPARYRLRAFVSHKGPSVHSGHYVAHVRVDFDRGSTENANKGAVDEGKGGENEAGGSGEEGGEGEGGDGGEGEEEAGEWVLFNDEKVVRADGAGVRALKALAYLYVFERV